MCVPRCSSYVVDCQLFVVHDLFNIVGCLLFATCLILHATRCVVVVVYRLVCIWCHTVFTVLCLLYTVFCLPFVRYYV